MSDSDDPIEAAERLEKTLERIAAAVMRPAAVPGEPPETIEKLDAIIARLRAGLTPDAA